MLFRARTHDEQENIKQYHRSKERLRVITLICILFTIVVLLTGCSTTDESKESIQGDSVPMKGILEDGIVAEYNGHQVRMVEIEEDTRLTIGTKEDALIRSLKFIMVYEEAIANGFKAVDDLSNREAQYDVMLAYFNQLIGDPVSVGGAEYKKTMNEYLNLSFEKYKHNVKFNEKYDEMFNYERIIELGGKGA